MLAVAVTEAEPVLGDLRSFVNERVLKRFKELLDEKRGDYKYAWEGDTTLKLEHRDNDECMACCMPGCFQNLVWKVTFGDAWVVMEECSSQPNENALPSLRAKTN